MIFLHGWVQGVEKDEGVEDEGAEVAEGAKVEKGVVGEEEAKVVKDHAVQHQVEQNWLNMNMI